MFDIGWSEMAIIALVTLVVMGPKELPNALRTFSHWVKQLRGMAREFQGGVDQLIREAELDDARKKLQETASLNINREIEKVVDPDRALQGALKPPPIDAKSAETKPIESKPTDSKPADSPHVQSALAAPAEAAPAELPAPAATAPVQPFPLAPAATNGAGAPHVNGADTSGDTIAPANGAGPSETSDGSEASASRKALG